MNANTNTFSIIIYVLWPVICMKYTCNTHVWKKLCTVATVYFLPFSCEDHLPLLYVMLITESQMANSAGEEWYIARHFYCVSLFVCVKFIFLQRSLLARHSCFHEEQLLSSIYVDVHT